MICFITVISDGYLKAMSQRFYRLVPDIKEFLKQHKIIDQFPKLSDDNWLIQLAFVVDITFHLNN